MPQYPAATDGGGIALPSLSIVEGTNATMGVATLAAGTVTVNTNKVAANSRIFLSYVGAVGGTQGFLRVGSRVAGTSFTINSSSGTDTSQVVWLLVNPVS